MAIKYECDKCGKIYDWYGTVNANKEYDEADFRERQRMDEEDRAAGHYYGRGAQWYPTNFIALGMVEPPNDNLGTNEGCMSADIGYNGTEDADKTDITMKFAVVKVMNTAVCISAPKKPLRSALIG